ncbi:adhesion G protein-coupled receptor A3 [Aedes albopictus]|uniref:G-protein coupled receptors family 2 profile 2 domain-containing protein n=1 Tax=Aedes albopictus TaxID=7160 RepID=A0ABM1YMM3_AEDAL|nr:adhesion G protein-coupled receptor A3 [Aedes albopictus]
MPETIHCVLVFICLMQLVACDFSCPSKCECTEGTDGLKAQCQSQIYDLKEIEFTDVAEQLTHIDLSRNKISSLDGKIFHNMTRLRSLDLSNNAIRRIDSGVLSNLLAMKKLNFSQNQIVSIEQGAFDNMPNLKILDLSSNPLACNCDLLWLVPWSMNASVKLQPAPKCGTPFKNMLLKKLRVGVDLHCASAGEAPMLQLIPSVDQVLFQGDPLRLRCRAPRLAVGSVRDSEDIHIRSHIFWGWSSTRTTEDPLQDIVFHEPLKLFPSSTISTRPLSDGGILDSTLIIPQVKANHSGTWDCRLVTSSASFSKRISVIVISNETHFCPETYTHDSKGSYSWPKTITGRTVHLPCANDAGTTVPYAYYTCTMNGTWINFDATSCAYVLESTRVLEQFSKTNLSGNILESARYLRNYSHTLLAKNVNALDLVYLTRTIENFARETDHDKDLGFVLMDIFVHLLKYSSNAASFIEAQKEDRSCQKLFYSFKSVVFNLPVSVLSKENIQVELFEIPFQGSTNGFSCTGISHNSKMSPLKCSIISKLPQYTFNERNVEVSLFTSFSKPFVNQYASTRIMISIFDSSLLFPNYDPEYRITSKVILLEPMQIGIDFSHNTTENTDIILVLKTALYHDEISKPIPVIWDPLLNDGLGGWSRKFCFQNHLFNRALIFSCKKFGVYAVMQNVKYLNDFLDNEDAGASFRYSEIGVYVGSVALFVACFFNIILYTTFASNIRMNVRKRHCLINLWLSLSALAFLYAFGIHLTEDFKVCEIVGLLMHYFTLATLLWYTTLLCNFYKTISRRRNAAQEIDTVASSITSTNEVTKKSKPLLGLYLVGYGISLLIGTIGAVNLQDYSSYNICFITETPALNSVIFPTIILIAFLVVLFLAVMCTIKSKYVYTNTSSFSEITRDCQQQQNRLNPATTEGSMYMDSCSFSTCSTRAQHIEYLSQLKVKLALLVLIILTWLAAATTSYMTTKNRKQNEKLFSIIYGALASILALSILYFYCFARSDFKLMWFTIRQPALSNHTTNISTCYHSTKGPTRIYSELTAVKPIGTVIPSASAVYYKKETNTASIYHAPRVEVFFNANQSHVARKFFRKQKRLARQRHFDLGKTESSERPDQSDDSSQFYFVQSPHAETTTHEAHMNELTLRQEQKAVNNKVCYYPNLLSDSCNESDAVVDINSTLNVRFIKLTNNPEVCTDSNLYTNIVNKEEETNKLDDTLINNLNECKPCPIYENNLPFATAELNVNNTKIEEKPSQSSANESRETGKHKSRSLDYLSQYATEVLPSKADTRCASTSTFGHLNGAKTLPINFVNRTHGSGPFLPPLSMCELSGSLLSTNSEQNLPYNPDNTPIAEFKSTINESKDLSDNTARGGTHRHTLFCSPTMFSDFKYQNSEVSLRSQDYYAPQPEKDDLNYRFSDIDDDSSSHGSQRSIDELYELINGNFPNIRPTADVASGEHLMSSENLNNHHQKQLKNRHLYANTIPKL